LGFGGGTRGKWGASLGNKQPGGAAKKKKAKIRGGGERCSPEKKYVDGPRISRERPDDHRWISSFCQKNGKKKKQE